MAEPTDLVLIEPDGSVRVVGRGAERRLRDRPGRYHLVSEVPGLLVLRRRGDETQAPETQAPEGHRQEAKGRAETRVAMAGQLLSRTSVLEIVNIIANANWRGELHVFAEPDTHRMLAIEEGAIKYANSDSPDDRLGQVLYAHGVITREQLDDLLMEVCPERRLGELLLEHGILTQEKLFGQLQKQVEQIFFSTLLAREGSYVFCVPDEDADAPVHRVHLPVQALLMEGVQRIDEMALFRERIPSDSLVPEPQPRVHRLTLDEASRAVLSHADGQRTLAEISRESGLGEFKTVKAAYGMLQQGGLVLRPRKTADAEAIRRLVEAFNEVLRDIFMAVATYGGIDQTRTTLETWIAGSGYGPIFGERIEEDGTIDTEQVVEALTNTKADNPMLALHQALHELAAFALFAATTSLPREQELLLSRDVNARLKRIRA